MNDAPELPDLTADDEQETLHILRAALASLPDPRHPTTEAVPAAVVEGAMWIHDWHNMSAELAQLTYDSAAKPELAGVRSTSALRQLTFVSGEFEIDLEIEPHQDAALLTGNISPIVGGTVEVLVGGVTHRGDINQRNGTFLIDNVDAGTVLAFVEIDAKKIRLGSFEI